MVAPGTLFEYLAAFITIVLAFALGDLLVSLHRLLRARRKVIWAPLPVLLATYPCHATPASRGKPANVCNGWKADISRFSASSSVVALISQFAGITEN